MLASELSIETSSMADGKPSDQFLKLLERFRADLINQAFVILGNQEDAEDVAQETLSHAYLKSEQLRDASRMGAWLRSINRRRAIKLHQRRHSKEERLGTAQSEALEAPRKTTLNTTAVVALDSLLRAVDALPEQYREVMVLRYWEKLSNDQIAERLGIPAGTVCSRMARANQILVQKVKHRLPEENRS